MVIGLLVRSGIVVGAVYYTNRLGVWGTSEETKKLYNDITNELCPHVQKLKQQLPFEVPKLPQTGEVRYLAKHYYNRGVKETFHFIHMLPCYAGQLAKKATDKYHEFASSPATDAARK